MAITNLHDYQRRRTLEYSAGLLQLATCCDHWRLDFSLRTSIAQKALSLLDEDGPPKKRRSRWHYLRGRAMILLQDHQEAAAALESSIQTGPHHVASYLALAWCHKRSGRVDLAVTTLLKAVTSMPDHAIVRYNLACYLSLAGRPHQAASELSVALALKPTLGSKVDLESDFDPIRRHPAFDAAIQQLA